VTLDKRDPAAIIRFAEGSIQSLSLPLTIDAATVVIVRHFCFPGGLLPRPGPEGFPVRLGQFGFVSRGGTGWWVVAWIRVCKNIVDFLSC
jgi:hypothetical protein